MSGRIKLQPALPRVFYFILGASLLAIHAWLFFESRDSYPRVEFLDQGAVKYHIGSFCGSMFVPAGLFGLILFCGIGISCFGGKGSTTVSSQNNTLTWKGLFLITLAALVIAVVVSETSGVSPFRSFFAVTVDKESVRLHSAFSTKEIPLEEIVDVNTQENNHGHYCYPILEISDRSGTKRRSTAEQFIQSDPQLKSMNLFLADIERQLGVKKRANRNR